jgi:hypothetical protein
MITWTIISMQSQPDTGIVVSANWNCSGEQEGFTSVLSGASTFNSPEGSYVAYGNLTQDEVLEWVWTSGGVDKFTTESSVMSAIVLQINPPVIQQPLPWSN